MNKFALILPGKGITQELRPQRSVRLLLVLCAHTWHKACWMYSKAGIRAATTDYRLICRLINQLMVWSENCPSQIDIQFTITYNKDKQQILTTEKLVTVNV